MRPATGLLAALGGCLLGMAARAEPLLTPFDPGQSTPPPPWRVVGLPQQTKPLTRFSVETVDGRAALRVEADRSYGNLVHPLHLDGGTPHLAWHWRVDQPLPAADLHTRAGDDTALKVCVLFELPMANVPFVDRQLLRLARLHSGEPLPAATVCYVWDSHLPVGSHVDNAFTRRMRYLVLESGAGHGAAHEWADERRDLAADFLQLFGDETDTPPPVIGVAVGADADNTQGHSLGHVADLVLEP